MRLLLVLIGGMMLGCAGPLPGTPPPPASSSPTIKRLDFSAVDGVSCMVVPRRGVLLNLDKPYEWSDCGPRSREAIAKERQRPGGYRDMCGYGWGMECCTEIGARFVGWEGHKTMNEKLASPLCLFE